MSAPVIFFAFANDKTDETRFLRSLDVEKEAIQKKLAVAIEAGLCEIIIEPDATIDEIIEIFQKPEYRDRIAIFHFAGHAGSFHLSMETAEGNVEIAHSGGLAAFLGLQENLQLVFSKWLFYPKTDGSIA